MSRLFKMPMAALLLLLFVLFAGTCAEEPRLVITDIPDSRLIASGSYYPLTAELDGTVVSCEWQVSDEEAARISSGKKLYVHALSQPRSFTVTATHVPSGKTAQVTLTAVPSAKQLRLVMEEENVTRETVRVCLTDGPVRIALNARTQPDYADEAIKWRSENKELATVDQKGTVTVLKPGACNIYAQTVNGIEAQVTVCGYFEPTELRISAPQELALREKAKIEAYYKPEEADSVHLRYTSSDPKVLSVDRSGNLQALRAGTATVTVETENGLRASLEIECYYDVSELYFRNYISPAVGETLQINVRVKPENAKYNTVTFESLDPHIAVVDENGFVTGISPGTARIRASVPNGMSAERNVRVEYMPLEELRTTVYYRSMHPGSTYVFAPEMYPKNASSKTLLYESDRPDVADADENGVITAHAPGRARITVTPASGECESVELSIRVCNEDALPLEGIIVGLNPGHQITRNFTQLPLAPGSRRTKNANSGYAIGVRTGNTEYQVVLDVSMYLKEELEALGATVVMTRTTNDVNINNIERAQMLNEAGCDIALQIHCDNGSRPEQNGFYAYVKTQDQESRRIAWRIIQGVYDVGGVRKNHCKFSDDYMSLNWSFTPSILLELGYMTNPDEDVLLGTPEYQMTLAKGIAQGLRSYFGF